MTNGYGSHHGVTADTWRRLVVDSGAVWLNYGDEESERVLGATRGGNTFEIDQEIREVEIDGLKGPVAGTRRIVRSVARITANLIELSPDNITIAIAGADWEEENGYAVITRADFNLMMEHHISNVALVGNVSGSTEPVVCIIYNAIADSNFTIGTEDGDESVIEVTFTAHYDPATIETEPWEIRFPQEEEGEPPEE